MFLFFVDSLLQRFTVRIRLQIFRPDLGSVRLPPLSHLLAHLLINTNLLTPDVSVFICKNIVNSFCREGPETNRWYRLLCFSASQGFIQHFFFLVFETQPYFLLYIVNCEKAPISCYLSPFTSHTLHFTFCDSNLLRISFKGTINLLQLFIFTNALRCSRPTLWVGHFIYLKFTLASSIVYQSLDLVQLKKQIG